LFKAPVEVPRLLATSCNGTGRNKHVVALVKKTKQTNKNRLKNKIET